MKKWFCYFVLLSTVPFGLIAWAQETTGEYDLLIRGGKVLDGTANPWFYADVAIRNGRIVRIGKIDSGKKAATILDATGKMVVPGFIDIHTHAESGILDRPMAENFLRQGVTTLIGGNCGSGPIRVKEYFDKLERQGMGVNLALLTGHNSLRRAVMKFPTRQATIEERKEMNRLLDQAMREGAWGLSTGFIYFPGMYADFQEVLELARVAADHGGIYATHMRNEEREVLKSILETLEVGRQAKIAIQISHFKTAAKTVWGQSRKALELIEKARREGIQVFIDQYPYTASSTSLDVRLPDWVMADGRSKTVERLQDPATRKRIIAEMREVIDKENGFRRLDYARIAQCPFNPALEGKTIMQVARLRKRKNNFQGDAETLLDLILEQEKNGGKTVRMIYFSMSEKDVEHILRAPFSLVASDSGIPEFGVGMPHPRSYGANVRILKEYVRQRGILTWEDAVRKMTSLPALSLGLRDRGLLREGSWADVVVLDPEAVSDQATYEQPHRYAKGISEVVLNGQIVLEKGSLTGKRAGQVLRRQ